MNSEKLKSVCDELSGLSYFDWMKVAEAVDEVFANKITEAKSKVCLGEGDELYNSIRKQFV